MDDRYPNSKGAIKEDLQDKDEAVKSLGIRLEKKDLKISPEKYQRIIGIQRWLDDSRESLRYCIFGEPTRPQHENK